MLFHAFGCLGIVILCASNLCAVDSRNSICWQLGISWTYPVFNNHVLSSACPRAAQFILLNAHQECIQCLRLVSKSEGDPVKIITALVSSIQRELHRGTQVLGSLFFVLTMSSSYCSDEHGVGVYDCLSGPSFTKFPRNLPDPGTRSPCSGCTADSILICIMQSPKRQMGTHQWWHQRLRDGILILPINIRSQGKIDW